MSAFHKSKAAKKIGNAGFWLSILFAAFYAAKV
jgi:hypothetical protein